MDTETFLLEREQIRKRLELRRYGAMAEHAGLPQGFLGLSWGDISQLMFSLGGGRGFSTWLPRVLITAVAPVFASFFRNKMHHFVSKKSLAHRVIDLLSDLRSRI